MSLGSGRRAGMIVLLALLLLLPLIALLPSGPGAVRLAGVSLLWWYAGLGAPLAAVAVTIAVLTTSTD
jgi:hypothetical protein